MFPQGANPKVADEVAAVRGMVAINLGALRQYKWTEHTEVRVKGDVKSSTDFVCRYDENGKLARTPINPAAEAKGQAASTSKRYMTRKKADMEDYIERAVGRMQNYAPPDPEQIDRVVREGRATLGKVEGGQSEIKLTYYYEEGDTMVFRYDSASKELKSVRITSTLGSPKDPVSMDVLFEQLPDRVNHMSTATLTAKSKKIEVVRKNSGYEKIAR